VHAIHSNDTTRSRIDANVHKTTPAVCFAQHDPIPTTPVNITHASHATKLCHMDCFSTANFMARSTIRANAIAVGQRALSQSRCEGDGLFKTQAETGGDECTQKSPLHPNLHFYHQSSALDWPLTTIRVCG
jgi:hypothetical protein